MPVVCGFCAPVLLTTTAMSRTVGKLHDSVRWGRKEGQCVRFQLLSRRNHTTRLSLVTSVCLLFLRLRIASQEARKQGRAEHELVMLRSLTAASEFFRERAL